MTPKELVRQFIELFSQGKYSLLEELLCEDLHFQGPWLEVTSRAEYLEALGESGDAAGGLEIIGLFEEGDQVAAFYQFSRDEWKATLAQLNRIRDNRISEIRLVFNPSDFSQ